MALPPPRARHYTTPENGLCAEVISEAAKHFHKLESKRGISFEVCVARARRIACEELRELTEHPYADAISLYDRAFFDRFGHYDRRTDRTEAIEAIANGRAGYFTTASGYDHVSNSVLYAANKGRLALEITERCRNALHYPRGLTYLENALKALVPVNDKARDQLLAARAQFDGMREDALFLAEAA